MNGSMARVALVLAVVAARAELPGQGAGPGSTDLEPGSEVEIVGLETDALRVYNGLRGAVLGYRSGRVGVRLADHGDKAFSPENVRAVGRAPPPKLRGSAQKEPPATPAPPAGAEAEVTDDWGDETAKTAAAPPSAVPAAVSTKGAAGGGSSADGTAPKSGEQRLSAQQPAPKSVDEPGAPKPAGAAPASAADFGASADAQKSAGEPKSAGAASARAADAPKSAGEPKSAGSAASGADAPKSADTPKSTGAADAPQSAADAPKSADEAKPATADAPTPAPADAPKSTGAAPASAADAPKSAAEPKSGVVPADVPKSVDAPKSAGGAPATTADAPKSVGEPKPAAGAPKSVDEPKPAGGAPDAPKSAEGPTPPAKTGGTAESKHDGAQPAAAAGSAAHDAKPAAPAPTDPPLALEVGDAVEVRDDGDAEWKRGSVVSVDGAAARVRIDGWQTADVWRFVRRAAPQQTTPAPPVPANLTWPVNKTAEWERTCWAATCKSAGRDDDASCEDEYICGNVTGCAYDMLDKPPCTMRRLQPGDMVILAPGVHDQGSLRGPEVGFVTGDARDEQPFEVRGPYSDVYIYGESDVLPAWGREVTWAAPGSRSVVLMSYRGRASFGEAAERVAGARVRKLVLKKPAEVTDSWADTPAPPVPTPPPFRQRSSQRWQPRPRMTPPPYVPPDVPQTPAPRDDSRDQFTPPPYTPPPYTPPPYTAPLTPPPYVAALTPPPVSGVSVGAGSVIVTAGEYTSVSGIYRVSGRHRGSILYKSNSCESKTCVMFMSGGGFWMISSDHNGHTRNVGSVKTQTKAGGKAPHHFTTWEFLDRESKKWIVGENTIVDTSVGMERRGVDWRRLIVEHSGNDPFSVTATPPPVASAPSVAAVDPNQLRIDPADGKAYTFSDFVAYYHGTTEWERAQVVSPSAAAQLSTPAAAPRPAAAAAPPPVAAAPAGGPEQTFFKGQAVVAVNDLKLGGTFVVRRGSPGVVSGQSGSQTERRWMVRFLGEFPMPVVMNVLGTDIRPG
eukprot:TRINITY_DN1185_c0_g1_i2.p1 TRINITY_DN1185_c0_g1~~TRINITY_DN1185_c0_g1_i2.p1  ORF type:complete len:1016 (+),score=273.35 TRINITY_DN1185_c0_g1_i2:57-3104(+)